MAEVFSVLSLNGPHSLSTGGRADLSLCVHLPSNLGCPGPVWDPDSFLLSEAVWLGGAGLMR